MKTTYIILTLSKNLVYLDGNGFPVKTLPVQDYVSLIGGKLSDLMDTVDINKDSLDDLGARVDTLESNAGMSPIYPTMVEPDLMGDSNDYEVPVILHELIGQFLDEKDVLGTPESLTSAIDTQPDDLASTARLDGPGTYGSIPGWVNTPNTIADSLKNMWLVIGNLVTGTANIKELTAVSCRDVQIDYVVVLSDNGQTVTVYFNSYCSIPDGFTDDGSIMHITDENGNTYQVNVDVINYATNIGGFEIDLSGTPLNTALDYTFRLKASLTNDTITCGKDVIKSVTNNASLCPSITTVPGSGSITFVMNVPLTANVTYKLVLYDNEASPVVDVETKEYANPASSIISGAFTGLSGDHSYYITPIVLIGGVVYETCTPIVVTTLP